MGDWRSASDLRGTSVDDQLIDFAEECIGEDARISGDPQALYVMAPSTVELGTDVWKWPVGLLVTKDFLVFVRRKSLTRRIETRRYFRYDFPQSGQPQSVGPGRFRMRFDHETLGPIRAYFATSREPEALADYFASG